MLIGSPSMAQRLVSKTSVAARPSGKSWESRRGTVASVQVDYRVGNMAE